MKKNIIQVISLIFLISQFAASGYARCSHVDFGGGGGGSPEVAALILISMTTTTLACMGPSKRRDPYEEEEYALVNHESLKEEIAKGEGEHLRTLAELFECSPSGQQYFPITLQRHYNSLFDQNGNGDGNKLYSDIKTIIRQDSTLRQECSNKNIEGIEKS